MDKGERIRLLQSCRDVLNAMNWDDQSLVLETFGIGSLPADSFGEGPSLTLWLNDQASDADLITLGQHLGLLENEPATMPESSADPEPLFIFASHLATERKFLGEVEEQLQRYEIGLFVAHDSIPMNADWNKEIEDALNACHAGAVFLHERFHESPYCQQECGWLLGRRIPVARLMLGESPRALLGKLQGKELRGKTAAEVAEDILDWAVVDQRLQGHLAASLSTAFKKSPSFWYTDKIWDRLSKLDRLTSEQLRRVIAAAEFNSQVYQARESKWGPYYRRVIADRATDWDADGLFADRITSLRDPNPTRPILMTESHMDDW